MTERSPTVSVVIPTYNRADRVGRAIRSVLAQTYRGFELIVVDDGSMDHTEQAVKGFQDPRIRYVRRHGPRGSSAARNAGIERSQGETIGFLDDDDEWLPGKLQHQLEVLRRAPSEVGLVYSDFVRVYPDGREERHRPVAEGISIGYTSRWLVRRKVLDEIGGFDEDMPALVDTEASLRIRGVCAALHDPVVVMRYYVTRGSLSRNIGKLLPAASLLIERYGRVVTKDELSHWYMLLGKAQMIEGEVGKARLSLLRAAWLRPLEPRHYGAFLAGLLGRRPYLWLRRLKRGPLREALS